LAQLNLRHRFGVVLAASVLMSAAQAQTQSGLTFATDLPVKIQPITAGVAHALSLPSAWHLALTGHPLIAQKQGSIGAAQDDIKSAKWKRYPTLTVDSTRVLGSQASGAANSDPNAVTLRLQQPLWTGGRITADIDAAEVRQTLAQLILEETEQDILLRVVQSYSDCQRLQERVVVAKDNVREHQRLYDLITRRLDQRVASEVDVALALARLQQSKTELLTLLASASNARSTLEQLIGQPIEVGKLLPPAPHALVWPDVQAAIAVAQQYAPMLRRLNAEVELARVDVVSKKSMIFPQVALRYEKYAGSATSTPFDRVMLALEYQPGSGLSSLPGMDAAAKRVGVAQSALDTGVRDVTDKVTNFYNEAASFAAQSDSTTQYAQAATSVMDSYLRQYKAGRKSWLEVFNAQREMALARYTAIDTAAGMVLSVYKLEIITGVVNRTSVVSSAEAAPVAH
jgi:adhesin transport system outer membrane protein